jgi:hypothetical protein
VGDSSGRITQITDPQGNKWSICIDIVRYEGLAADCGDTAAHIKNSIDPVFFTVRALQVAHAHIFNPRSSNRLRDLYKIANVDVRCISNVDGMRAERDEGVSDVGGRADIQRKVAFYDDANVRISNEVDGGRLMVRAAACSA